MIRVGGGCGVSMRVKLDEKKKRVARKLPQNAQKRNILMVFFTLSFMCHVFIPTP
jgi:hypothetical protein